MLSLINDVVAILLASFSFPVGYLVGSYTDSEISGISKRINIGRLFGLYLLAVELVIILVAYRYAGDYYVIILDISAILNISASALYTSIKFDLIRMINYQVIFLVVSLSGALLLNLL